MKPFTQRGACPTALQPMQSGDGLLMRLHLMGGALSLTQAKVLASASQRLGNGQIDLTQRGNLQIRGLSEANFLEIIPILREVKLASRQSDMGHVMVSPMSGICSDLPNLISHGRLLEARLQSEPKLANLPQKFSFILEDGGPWGLENVTADVRFIALGEVMPGHFAGFIDGMIAPIFICKQAELVDKAVDLALTFVDSSALHDAKRMRDICGLVAGRYPASAIAVKRKPSPIFSDIIGILPKSLVGMGAAFGRLDAASLHALVLAAEQNGGNHLHFTPWRTILVSLASKDHANALMTQMRETSFILDSTDSRLRIAACVGAPACGSASTNIHLDAEQLAKLLALRLHAGGIGLHISGCAKGCAHPQKAALTLVARSGSYDWVVNGTARDAPAFSALSIEAAIHALTSNLLGEPLGV